MPIRLITTPSANEIAPKYTLVETAWGCLGFACRGSRLVRLILPGLSKTELSNAFRTAFSDIEYDPEILPHLQRSLMAYFQAESMVFDGEVDISRATPFARRVYQSCSRIPLGSTITYANLAEKAGSPQAARAVGSIMAANPTPLIIPCHRVLRSDGKLGGFSAPGGQNLKKRLITHESKIMTDMNRPEKL
jgi:O-6-methylguanine DNA methyltransferase